MKHQYSRFTHSEGRIIVEMLFADAPDFDKAKSKILICIPVKIEDQSLPLEAIEIAALDHVRIAIGLEYSAKKQIVDQRS